MSVASDSLAFFRTQWTERFVDTCTVKRLTGNSFNDSTGVYTPTYTTQYSGACLVRPLTPGEGQFGQELVDLRGYTVFVPHDEGDPLPDDLVDIVSTFDGFLNGKQFVVRNVAGDTYDTVRRLHCQEVVNG